MNNKQVWSLVQKVALGATVAASVASGIASAQLQKIHIQEAVDKVFESLNK